MAAEIIGAYRLHNLLMSGQTSQVWEVSEIHSHRHFAMKILLPEKSSDGEARRMLFHEAMVGEKMAHPNVVRIFKVVKDAKPPYFIMEFFPSGSLKLRIVRKQLDWVKERIQGILKQAATGLAYMNESGWVHRDVKPDNMLVNSAGDLKIIDFAIAERIKKPTLMEKLFRTKRKVQGTRSYMSPEQIQGQALDTRSDIYSFGACCYELVTGRPPFRAGTNQELLEKHILAKPESPLLHNRDVTDEFSDLVLHMLAKQPKHRPENFHQVLMKLRQIRVFKT